MLAQALFHLLILFPQAPQVEPSLPDLKTFLNEFQVKRPGLNKALGAWGLADNRLRSKYTYTETCTTYELDSKGKVKSAKKNVYEVVPSSGPLVLYRRQIVKDGKPLTEKQLEKQDREFNKESQELAERIQKAREKAAATPKPVPPKDVPPPPPLPAPEPMFMTVFDFQMVGRETFGGHPAIVLSFKPKPGVKTSDDLGQILQHVEGKAWVSEDDYELVKVAIEVFEPIKFGGGLLAKVQKGSKASMEWTKINNEIWLPSHREATADARILLLKGWHESEVTEFSNHRKYVVETELKFGEVVGEKSDEK
jgi:hypothetical protein